MFTGIITEIGVFSQVRGKGVSMELLVRAPETAREAEPGDSVAVDGVCLTVRKISGDILYMDVGEETYRRTILTGKRAGDVVNIEPSLRMGGKIGGHIVTGHVDAVGTIAARKKRNTEVEYTISFPREVAPFIAEKGSVALDGISLTVGKIVGNTFSIHIIPHTIENTTLKNKSVGDHVNIEVDILARYVVRAMRMGNRSGGVLPDMLVEYGYTGADDA